jgi:spore coat protein U-like protein
MKSHRAQLLVIMLCVACFAATAGAAVSCGVSTTGVAFGSYDPVLGQNRDTSGTISVSCTGNSGDSVSYSLLLSAGNGAFSSRAMAGSAVPLQYNLYTDIARSQVWGDGTGGTLVVSDSYSISTSPTVRNYTVYGRIPAGETGVTAAAYNDSIAITLDY